MTVCGAPWSRGEQKNEAVCRASCRADVPWNTLGFCKTHREGAFEWWMLVERPVGTKLNILLFLWLGVGVFKRCPRTLCRHGWDLGNTQRLCLGAAGVGERKGL